MKIAVTGHRPDKLGGYEATEKHNAIRSHMCDFLLKTQEENHSDILSPTLISGGALGIDKFWIEVGHFLKLPVIAALPFKGYDSKWPTSSRREYKKLLDQCKEVLYGSDSYSPDIYQERNKWMVDHCDLLVAYWNGSAGGTANCLKYAKQIKREAIIFNPDAITGCLS